MDEIILITDDVINIPPPTGSYYAWEFEDNLDEFGGSGLTLTPDSTLTLTYPTGQVNKCVDIVSGFLGGNDGNIFNLVDPGSEFNWVSSNPLTISWRMKTPNNVAGSGINILLYYNNTTLDSVNDDDYIYRFRVAATARSFYRKITATTSELKNSFLQSMNFSGGTWNFHYILFDPTNPNNLIYGINNVTPLTLTFTSSWNQEIYDANMTFAINTSGDAIIAPGTDGDGLQLDQFTVWTEVKSVQDMLDLYNNGNATPLP